jgi:hypothetical protein
MSSDAYDREKFLTKIAAMGEDWKQARCGIVGWSRPTAGQGREGIARQGD